jgi:hypothetical protein
MTNRLRTALGIPALALFGIFAVQNSAMAAEPDFSIDLPAGQACPGFDLRLEVRGFQQVHREFSDKSGNVVRVLDAGKGSLLTFTNLQTGASATFKTGGSVSHAIRNRDGTSTVSSTGHNAIILFPTDTPPGPSTTIYIGNITYSLAPGNVFTLQSFNGTAVNICGVLST